MLAPLQLFIGDQHGLNTLKYQPIKIAAMEGHWDGSKPGDFHIFAWPDEKAEENRFAMSIPRGSSLVLTHDPDGLFPGLKSVPPSERPPVVTVFFAFRIMLAIGLLHDRGGALWRLAAAGAGGCSRPGGICGVMAHELVDRLCRSDRRLGGHRERPPAVDRVRHPAHGGRHLAGAGATVATTLALFVLVYGIVFAMGIYYINRLIAKGPEGSAVEPPSARRPAVRSRPPATRAAKRCNARNEGGTRWNRTFPSSGPR